VPIVRILTNIDRFPSEWSVSTGESGTACIASGSKEFFQQAGRASLILINSDVSLVFKLCEHALRSPASRRPIVAVDLVLTKPYGFSSRVATVGKRLLLSRVDLFVNYFKQSEGYAKYYGITPERSSFVHFKPNIRYRYDSVRNFEGDYILCFGKSRRDYDTFFRAAATISYPCAILQPNVTELRRHGSRFSFAINDLPRNVSVLPDDGTEQSMVYAMEHAKAVALPIIKDSLLAGVGVCLNAMYLHKCVIITEGAGVSDVLTDEAMFVRAEDVNGLARAMRLVWENDSLRVATAAKGYQHAASLGGEPELYQRVLEATVQWLRSSDRWKHLLCDTTSTPGAMSSARQI
jgi:glycosyltransferase involved in cell wall biosynthesis